MKPKSKWVRNWFSREMPLREDSPLTASFEMYDSGVLGIHIHNCFCDGMLNNLAIDIINRFSSRTEYDETRKGIYIFVKGELPYFDGFVGLEIETYYFTEETIVFNKIVENQEAIDWLLKEYPFFLNESDYDYADVKYYRNVTMKGDVLKISAPNVKKGSRHKTLLSYGGKLLSDGYSSEKVEIKMYDFNMLYCVPPLPFEDFQSIVKSVMKYNRGCIDA